MEFKTTSRESKKTSDIYGFSFSLNICPRRAVSSLTVARGKAIANALASEADRSGQSVTEVARQALEFARWFSKVEKDD